MTLVSIGKMLTMQQAADILNVSRPFLIGLPERGDLHCSMTGRRRRIEAEKLFAYKDARDHRRAKALEELALNDADDL